MTFNQYRRTMFFSTIVFMALLMGCSAQTPGVRDGDPLDSFFRDQVTYPFRVKYADARSDDGTVWEVGYMDVKPLFKINPKVLVLIHGRAFTGAYFGHVARIASQHGIRVVVPDLPNCGKSLPGNLDKPLSRTMQQSREVIHDLIVNKLGIEKATYGGHSLGGQFILGYALSYPDAVERIILNAPAGLEELPAKHFPARLAKSIDKNAFVKMPYYAKKIGLDFMKDQERIELFYYYKWKNKAGKVIDIPIGFFKKECPDARISTDIRKMIITANPEEFKRYSITSFRDIYNLGVEIQKEDKGSLFKQYHKIRSPILLIFGEKEPFYPKKISGLKSLKKDMIRPFYRRMTAAGCPVMVKLYPGCGHFPHTDMPDQFARDVVKFTLGDTVNDTVNPNTF